MGRLDLSVDANALGPGKRRSGFWAQGRSAELIQAFPWEETPLGPLTEWDHQFVASLNLVLEAHFPMFITCGEANHLFYNDAFETVLVGKGDCIGLPISTVFPEAWPHMGHFLTDALDGQSNFIEDLPVALVRNSTLSSTWWSVSYSPARSEEGEVVGVLGVLYETTRRVTAEETLRQSEATLIAVTDMVPSLLWRCDANGRFTWVNQGLQTYFGIDDLAGVHWDDNVEPEDIETGRRVHAANIRAGRPFECQQRLRSADGQFRWFGIRAQQIVDEGGEVSGWYGSASDIHDWRMAADNLKEREELLHRFYESDATLMWVGVVATREIEALNPGCRKAWALPEDGSPTTWENWLSFAHPDDRPQLSNMFDQAAGGDVIQARFRSISETGSMRRFHATGFAIPDGGDGRKRVGGLVVEVASNEDPRIYLIDAEPGSQNAMFHGLTRKGFKVRAFDDAAEFQKISGDLAPGCAILVIRGDIESSLKTAAILKANRRLPWIAVGDFEDRLHDVIQLMKLGAADILTSPGPDDVAAASHAALAVTYGKAAESRAPADARQKITQLSQRERQVFEGLVAGGTNKTIAKDLDLSPRTVETHRAHLMDRLGVKTLAELVKLSAEGRIESRG